MQNVRYLSLNGKVVPFSEAQIHILTPGFKYGAGVFEGIRAYRRHQGGDLNLFQLHDHLDRLAFSMKVMRMEGGPGAAEIETAIRDLIAANEFDTDLHIRVLAWVDGEGDIAATGPVGWAIAALPRPINPKVTSGLHVSVASWRRLPDNVMPPRVKATANYNSGRLASFQGKADGYDNVLLLTESGKVAETPLACFFMVRDGVPVTPSVTSGILESLTRKALISLFREKFGLTTIEREIDRTELYAAEEAFLCGSGAEIQPVISVDRLPVGTGSPGSLTRKLQAAYFANVRSENASWQHWLTSVQGRETVSA